MNFCFVYKEDYPWDVRVEKIVNTLLSLGHKVDLACKNIDQKQTVEKQGDLTIFRLPKTANLPNILRKMINLALWFNPFWLYLIYKVAKKNNSQIIIVRDLPLMLSGILVAKLLKIKIIFDMAECYPEMYRSAATLDKVSIVNKILKNPGIAAAYEKYAIRHCDHVFVMVEESKSRLTQMGFSSEKITIVSNTPIVNAENVKPLIHSGDELRIVYVGFLTKIRGIDLLVQATRKFIDHPSGSNKIRVDIIGTGSAKEYLTKLVDELNLHSIVKVHGWLEHSDVKRILSDANVGSLTYRVCSHWNNTIPNKIFDYMLNGLPVLATRVIPIARILESESCGLVSDDLDVNGITENLILLSNPEYRFRLGNNGQQSILHKYNWANDTERLKLAMEKLYY